MIVKYEKYKDSGVEWIGEIPEGWETKKIKYLALGENTLFLDGDWIESKDIVFDDSQIRYITTGNVGEGKYKDQGLTYITEETFKRLKCTEIFPGDLLISRLNPPIGRCCIVPDLGNRIVTSVDNVVLRPNVKYYKSFLNYSMSNSRYYEYTSLIARGATMQRISRGLLGNVELPVTTDGEEQKAIALFLDRKTVEIDQLIEYKENLIALYEEEKTTVINHTVTKGLDPALKTKPSGIEWLGDIPEHWEVKRLKYVKAEVKNSFVDGPFGSHLKTEHFVNNGDVYVIDSGYITSGNFLHHKEFKTITKEHFETIKRSESVENDIIIAKIGANFGMSGVLPKLDKPSVVSGNSLKLTIGEGFGLKYIHYQLLNLKQIGVIDIEVKGSAQPALSMQLMSEMPFLKTTEDEQIAIVAHIETECSRLDTIIDKFKKQIELFQEYRAKLVSDVVTGKIDVRDEVAV
jgi:type I restriction enzyme, S subunit